MKQYRLLIALLCFSVLIHSCSQNETGPNTLTKQEKNDGWELLFDGKTIDGWHPYNQKGTTSVWYAKDGELICDPQVKKLEPADLVTDKIYTNYDFHFEWKISKAGNSGVFINVQEDTAYVRAWTTGPEYQLLDNTNVSDHNYGDPKRQAGALYGLVPIKNNAASKPYTEWNEGRILQQDGKISFWLNNVLTAEEDLKSDRWKQLVDSSSLGKYPAFGKATSGRIGLQDWARGVSFRNLKIKELK